MYIPHGIYAYNKYGTNWRAVVAFFVGFVPLLPSFAAAVTSSVNVPQGAINFYYLGYFWGFFVGGGLHVLLSKIWPAKETMIHGKTVAIEPEV